jgi:hypothetical protein
MVTQGHVSLRPAMLAELVATDVDLATRDELPETVHSLQGVWMRLCPVCQAVLCKSEPSEPVRCVCGWEWQV